MKKILWGLLTLSLVVGLFAGCAGEPVAESAPVEPQTAPGSPETATDAVKTGLAILASLAKSQSAAAENGVAQSDVTLVAVTVDEAGVIDSCVIDGVQAKIGFDAAGKLVTDPSAQFPSKNELGAEYGMKKASSIGKEWNEQAAAFAAYAVGKTVDELKGMAVSESGAPADADLAASVTIRVGDFLAGIEKAVDSAVYLGAQTGDRLSLVSLTDGAKSTDASAAENGRAQADVSVAALTFHNDVITSCLLDGVQMTVTFDAGGVITSDLGAAIRSKNELGAEYGMKKASSIGKEWNEQAAAFADYVTGKTVDEVANIAVNEQGAPADADLAASVTIRIGNFQALIARAAT